MLWAQNAGRAIRIGPVPGVLVGGRRPGRRRCLRCPQHREWRT